MGYIKEHPDLDVHSTARLPLPIPEFYVIYTGGRQNVPPVISIRKDFFKDDAVPFDLEARVVSTESTDDIIGQYIIFTHVFDQQVKQHGYTRKAAEETVRVCKDRGVLKGYLEAHETEVVNSMIMLFEQEKSVKRYGNRMRSEGRAEGRAEGRDEGKMATLCEFVNDGILSIEQAAKKAGMTVEQFKAAVEALKVTA